MCEESVQYHPISSRMLKGGQTWIKEKLWTLSSAGLTV